MDNGKHVTDAHRLLASNDYYRCLFLLSDDVGDGGGSAGCGSNGSCGGGVVNLQQPDPQRPLQWPAGIAAECHCFANARERRFVALLSK